MEAPTERTPTSDPEAPTARLAVGSPGQDQVESQSPVESPLEREAPAESPAEAARAGEPAAVVPVGQLRQESQKTSFWKRIRLRGRSALDPATSDDRMISRLDGIASRIETSEQHLGERIRELDERFSEVWEVEEQLSRLMELREMTEDLQERQGRIDGRLRSLERRLSFLTLLAATAAAAGLAAVAIALL